VIDASAQIGLNQAARVLEAIVASAQTRILIQTPYFNPTQELADLLIDAVDRGVEIDTCVPGPHIDKRISAVVAEDAYATLISKGLRVWIYQTTMMHTKAVIVDGILSVVGSVNFNRRSIEKDEEVAVAILDQGIAATLEGHFSEDVKSSVAANGVAPLSRKLVAKLLKPINREM
jgi:cardiolipin synthase